MQIKDVGTISPSGRFTNVYTTAAGDALAVVPDDHPKPAQAATRALMLYLAEREWKTGETLMQARARMRDYLREKPPVQIGTGREIVTGHATLIFSEAE